MIAINVSVATNLSFGFSGHFYAAAPVAPPVPTPSFEVPVQLAHPPGMVLNTCKLAFKVLHAGQPIIQSGHDCGPTIMDITLGPPANALYPLEWAFSSRKMAFAASTVTAGGSAVACAYTQLCPMIGCGQPVSLPLSMALNPFNNVLVGMSISDLAYGWAGVAASMAIDLLINKMWPAKGLTGSIESAIAAGIFPTGKSDWAKAALGAAAGLALSELRKITSGDAPSATFSMGTPYLGASVSYSADPSAGFSGSSVNAAMFKVAPSSTPLTVASKPLGQ